MSSYECSLCGGSGRVIVWHHQCIIHFREYNAIPRRLHRSCATSCPRPCGDRYRWLPTYDEHKFAFYHTLADEREMMLAAWCEEHFAPVTTYDNGIEHTEFR